MSVFTPMNWSNSAVILLFSLSMIASKIGRGHVIEPVGQRDEDEGPSVVTARAAPRR